MTTLRDRALALVTDVDDLPFVLVESTTGELAHTTIVTTNSARAMIAGRRAVRELAATAAAYAIVIDSFVRLDDVRSDALLVEHATRGDATAEVTVHTYGRDGNALVLSVAIPFERRPSALVPLDAFALQWGAIHPDFYRARDNHAAYSINHALETDEQIVRTARFLGARARMLRVHLPRDPSPMQTAHVDDRGQAITAAQREDLVRRLNGVMAVEFRSERD